MGDAGTPEVPALGPDLGSAVAESGGLAGVASLGARAARATDSAKEFSKQAAAGGIAAADQYANQARKAASEYQDEMANAADQYANQARKAASEYQDEMANAADVPGEIEAVRATIDDHKDAVQSVARESAQQAEAYKAAAESELRSAKDQVDPGAAMGRAESAVREAAEQSPLAESKAVIDDSAGAAAKAGKRAREAAKKPDEELRNYLKDGLPDKDDS